LERLTRRSSVWDYDAKQVVVIPSAVGEPTLPSVVGLDDETEGRCGRSRGARRVLDPRNTIIEIKRDMGEYSSVPNPATNDPGVPSAVSFRGRDYCRRRSRPFILAELKRQAETFWASRFTTP